MVIRQNIKGTEQLFVMDLLKVPLHSDCLNGV